VPITRPTSLAGIRLGQLVLELGHKRLKRWGRAGMAILRADGVAQHEMTFVYDMVRRFRAGGFEPSEKQMNWFVSIYRKYVD